MAEGFTKKHGTNVQKPFSAGSKAFGKINKKAVIAMKEIGYDLTKQKTKCLDEFIDLKFDYLTTT